MFTAKKIMKANFLAARKTVAAMDTDSILFDDSCNDYELPSCIFYRREVRRAARRFYAADAKVPTSFDLTERHLVEAFQAEPDFDLTELLREALAA